MKELIVFFFTHNLLDFDKRQ